MNYNQTKKYSIVELCFGIAIFLIVIMGLHQNELKQVQTFDEVAYNNTYVSAQTLGTTDFKSLKSNQNTRPNFVFIIADDMYPNMFNNLIANGEISGTTNLTPALDRLIREGVWLGNMKVVSPLCTPSRYNVLTGNFASRATNKATINTSRQNSGQRVVQWNSYIVPGQEKTMGTYFQNLGYKTGFVGKNHVIESLAQIGEQEEPDLDAKISDPKIKQGLLNRYQELQKDIRSCGFDYADGLYHNNPNWSGIEMLNAHNMDWVAKKGIEFIENHQNEPFFLYFATTLTHGPVNPGDSWKSDRKLTPIGRLDDSPNVFPSYEGELGPGHKKLIADHPDFEPTVRNYVSINRRLDENGLKGKGKENLLWLDDAVNALLNKLDETGVIDNTIIVFFNDHGQELKGTLYEKGINTQAFMWKKGGFKAGKSIDIPLSNVDFLPTLLEIAGQTVDPNVFDGYSFKSALDGKKYKARTAMYYELGYARAIVKDNLKYYVIRYPKWAMELTYEERKAMLEKQNRYKQKFGIPGLTSDPSEPFGHLVMLPGGEAVEKIAMQTVPNYADADQVYDLKKDPNELNNLIDNPRYARKIRKLKEELILKLSKLPGNYTIDDIPTTVPFKD